MWNRLSFLGIFYFPSLLSSTAGSSIRTGTGTSYATSKLAHITNAISKFGSNDGYCIIDNFLENASISAFADDLRSLKSQQCMSAAGVGRSKVLNKAIRSDSIHWIVDDRQINYVKFEDNSTLEVDIGEPNQSSNSIHMDDYFDEMEGIRTKLNEAYFLGLFTLHSHLSNYDVGGSYSKHLDQFATSKSPSFTTANRKVSSILYLNHENWDVKRDGGCLRLYLEENGEYLDIAPIGGRLVLFLSEKYYHEVLPARRTRMSLTGWFHTTS